MGASAFCGRVFLLVLCGVLVPGAVHDADADYFDVARVASNDVLTVRAKPGATEREIGAIPPNGRGVLFLDDETRIGQSTWKKVQYEVTGWVNASFLTATPGDAANGTFYAVTRVAANDSLTVRASPGGEAIGSLPYNGRGIRFLDQEGQAGRSFWKRVRYRVVGWVNATYLVASSQPEGSPAGSNSVVAYLAGNKYFVARRYDLAEQYYSAAIDARPEATYYLSRGNARLALMQYDDATVDYGEAIDIRPNYAPTYLARGTLLWLVGSVADAENDFRMAVRLEPDNSFYYTQLGSVLYEQNKYAAVGNLYRAAFRDDPSRNWALAGWLGSLFEQKQYDDILKVYAELSAQNVYVTWLYYYAGRVYEERDQQRDALIAYRHALEHDSDDQIPIDTFNKVATMERSYETADLRRACDGHRVEYFRRMGRVDDDPEWCFK